MSCNSGCVLKSGREDLTHREAGRFIRGSPGFRQRPPLSVGARTPVHSFPVNGDRSPPVPCRGVTGRRHETTQLELRLLAPGGEESWFSVNQCYSPDLQKGQELRGPFTGRPGREPVNCQNLLQSVAVPPLPGSAPSPRLVVSLLLGVPPLSENRVQVDAFVCICARFPQKLPSRGLDRVLPAQRVSKPASPWDGNADAWAGAHWMRLRKPSAFCRTVPATSVLSGCGAPSTAGRTGAPWGRGASHTGVSIFR